MQILNIADCNLFTPHVLEQSPTGQALYHGYIANPLDDAPRLILADWLEEGDDFSHLPAGYAFGLAAALREYAPVIVQSRDECSGNFFPVYYSHYIYRGCDRYYWPDPVWHGCYCRSNAHDSSHLPAMITWWKERRKDIESLDPAVLIADRCRRDDAGAAVAEFVDILRSIEIDPNPAQHLLLLCGDDAEAAFFTKVRDSVYSELFPTAIIATVGDTSWGDELLPGFIGTAYASPAADAKLGITDADTATYQATLRGVVWPVFNAAAGRYAVDSNPYIFPITFQS